MGSNYQWDDLDPYTHRQIEAQEWDRDYSKDPLVLKACGCEHMRKGQWSLCGYHQAVEDTASEMREEIHALRVAHLSAESELATERADAVEATKVIIEMQEQLAEGRTAYRVWSDAASLAAVKLDAMTKDRDDWMACQAKSLEKLAGLADVETVGELHGWYNKWKEMQ